MAKVLNGSKPFGYPNYMSLYDFEDFDYDGWQEWMRNNWSFSVYLSAVYVALIYIGRLWMANREPYKFKQPLILWNLGLAIFSAVGFLRTLPEVMHLLGSPNGFHLSACSRDRMHLGTVFWCLMMTLSKAIELGDTAFIVLRKQPLIFLHWYHHATVLMYCWFTYAFHEPGHRWFMPINFGIHTAMYFYYALRAMRVQLPRQLSVLITSSQLVQMFFGVWVNCYALYAKFQSKACQAETLNLWLALGMYASYAVLFGNFFNKSYLQKKKQKSA